MIFQQTISKIIICIFFFNFKKIFLARLILIKKKHLKNTLKVKESKGKNRK